MTKVLIVTPFFLPNIGGAETYVYELVEYLRKHGCSVNVLTYQPITTPNVRGKSKEIKENLTIRRYSWIGFNLFGKLEKLPFLNFLYLTPYLLLRSFFWMLSNSNRVEVIDAQGFNSGFIALVLKLFFKKKTVLSVMSLYDFVPGSFLSRLVNWIISKMDHIIVESDVSKAELVSIGVPADKITPYVEWLDLDIFKPETKSMMKKKLGLESNFLVLFVGRALEIKGIDLMIEVAKRLKDSDIDFLFISNAGPLMERLKQVSEEYCNIHFIPGVPYHELPKYESAADLAVIPSKYSENSAITVLTAISCGTPVIASRVGAIPGLIDDSVGLLTEPTQEGFFKAIRYLNENRDKYEKLMHNCRPYAEKHFSTNNASTIHKVYVKLLEKEFQK